MERRQPCLSLRVTMMASGVYVIGAGGHAKVTISTLRAQGITVLGAFDDDVSKRGGVILGVPIIGSVDDARKFAAKGKFLLAVGNNEIRKSIAESLEGLEWATAVHPTAYVHPSVKLGPGTVVFAGAILQPEAVVGSHCIVNTGATIDHDCKIDDYVHLAPGVHLAGGVSVGSESMFGVGAAVLPNINIGARSTIGAGAVVIKNVPDDATAVGVPARLIAGREDKNERR